MDIGDWLRALKLERYQQAFQDNDVDVDLLSDLSEADLEKLGVASLGHRKILLRAIGRLRRPSRVELAGTASGGTDETMPPPFTVMSEAERRQLTVLFCDLADSTALATTLDPEDMGAIVRAYHDCCAQTVKRWEGHLAKYMGDGVVVYFGYPRASEGDAERAVRAGLALTKAVGQLRLPSGRALAARVGIATGLVMVGELIGEGVAVEQAVIGETPNLAARLQALAKPGGTVISQATRRLIGGLFELVDLGPQRLKGFAEPLAVWQVVAESRAGDRFEALHGERLTPLVGREHELGILLERWAWAKDGDGQVVLIAGEPGIGKSRLIRTLREQLGDEPYTPLSHFSSPYHINSALHPVISLLERAARLGRDEPPAEQLAKLEAMLDRSSFRVNEALPLLATLCGLASDTRYPLPGMTPEIQKRRTFQVLIDQLMEMAERQPVLALYEDVHWLDPSTLELLGLVIERVWNRSVLVIITFRSEFEPPWTHFAHVTTLAMSRLGRRQGADLVARVTGGKAIPAEVVEQIVARTDGVPLFVEELTKTVLESGLLADAGDRYELSGALPPLAIPATLHDSLMARLDRLAPVKEVAQVGAVIGREFSRELLAAVVPHEENQLEDALAQLVSSELVFCRGSPPDTTYAFKHALVQDAAYQSLLKSSRQQLHAQIAQVIEQRFSEVIQSGPEVLARHFTYAGLAERAIPYWHRAGELAAARSANKEAVAHLNKALELVATLPHADEALGKELALRIAIGGPLIAIGGHPAPAVEQSYSRAHRLGEQLGRTDELFPVLRGLWNCHLVRGDLKQAHELAGRLAPLADQHGAPLRRGLARRALGTTLFYLGHLDEAIRVLDEGVAIDDAVGPAEDPQSDLLLYTERAGVVCRLYSAWALWFQGFPDLAIGRMEAALALSKRLEHVHSFAFALNFAANLHIHRGEFEAALDRARAAVELSREMGLTLWLAQALMCESYARFRLNRQAEQIKQLRAGLNAWNATGARLLDTQWLAVTADAYLRTGDAVGALTTLDRADETYAATGECHFQAEVCRLRGGAMALAGGVPSEDAEGRLQRAIRTAREQGAKSLELRAATSLARLWAEQGDRRKAYDLLAPTYGWFSEGFDTADLKDAKVLLDELA